ncbi:MAG: cyclic nucleotide-binding domain-containing protein [Thermoanaerobaculia bacterium]
MVFELLASSKSAKVPDLIARKKYAEALAMLQEQLRNSPGDNSLRMQTADVLALQGKVDEATRLLEAVADDFAMQGFAAKATAVLKKIQKLDPARKDLEPRIVELFKSQGGAAPVSRPRTVEAPAQAAADSMLDLGIVPPDDDALDIGFESPSPANAPAPPPAPEPIAAALFDPGPASAPLDLSGSPGASELLDFSEFSGAEPVASEAEESRRRSPLFDDLSEDELLEVMRGLELLTYEPGDILVSEGEKGDSLYVLTSGSAKAFVRNRDGGNTQVRQLNEGDFFGEISILTGKPRTATITAAGHCELLRLDRATLDAITSTHPRVREVLQQFYEERTHNAAEAEIRGLDAGSSETCRQAGLADESHGEQPRVYETVVITEEDLEDDPAEVRLAHLRRIAIEHSRKQNWADAVQAWQQYIALKPEDTDAANALGVLFGKVGRWMEAAQTFERLVVLKSKDATLLFNLGLSYRQLDQLPQAAGAFRQALAIKPDYDNARKGLASVLDRIKKSARA